jgi:branched-chain amino acid transport system permease protein
MSESQILLENFLQSLTAGILIGAIYGLMCVGLAMIFGIMRVINFAQGDFMMLGMYVAYYIFIGLGVQGLFGGYIGPYLAILLAAPLLFLFGYLIHKSLIARVTGMRTTELEGEGHYAQLVLTLGIALILQNGGMILFGSQLVSIRSPLSSIAWEVGPLSGDFVSIFVNKGRGIAGTAPPGRGSSARCGRPGPVRGCRSPCSPGCSRCTGSGPAARPPSRAGSDRAVRS